jgi:hypothetical protein
MARDVAMVRYGDDARRKQNVVYALSALWISVVTAYFGVLLWADEAARSTTQ